MIHARKSLATIAFAALIGCTVHSPAMRPVEFQPAPRLYATESTVALGRELTRRFTLLYPETPFEPRSGSFDALTQGLQDKTLDYFVSSHAPTRADLWAAPLALGGIAIVAHSGNPVDSLSLDELRGIFSGELKRWRDLGGREHPIQLFAPPSGSDVAREFRRMVMGSLPLSARTILLADYSGIIEEVTADEGAIGILPLSRVDGRVQALSVEGVAPSADTIADLTYPLRSIIYIVGREAPPPAYHNFIGWAQSAAGQALIPGAYAPLP